MSFLIRNSFHVLLALLIGLSLAGCSSSQQSAQNKIDSIAKNIKPELPKMLDKDTKLVKVYTKKLELISEYELINFGRSSADSDNNRNKIEFYLKNQVCPGIKEELLNKGISSRYIYSGNNGEIILNMLITSSDC